MACYATIETSISASRSTFLTKSPADPTLDSNDDTSASKTSVSREVLLLDWVDATDANTEWAENAMPIAILGCIMDSTHWQTYPGTGFLGPASARHWSMMSTFSTCTLPRDMVVQVRACVRCALMISHLWTEIKFALRQLRPRPFPDLPATEPHEDGSNVTNFLVFLYLGQLCLLWWLTHILSFEVYPQNHLM